MTSLISFKSVSPKVFPANNHSICNDYFSFLNFYNLGACASGQEALTEMNFTPHP